MPAWLLDNRELALMVLAGLAFHGLLLVTAWTEWRTGVLPVRASLTGVPLGLAAAAAAWPQTDALMARSLGAAGGFGVLWLAGLAQARWRPRAAGQGCLPEAVLFALVGAWLGWRALPGAMLGAFIVLALARLLRRPARRAASPGLAWASALALSVILQEVLVHAV